MKYLRKLNDNVIWVSVLACFLFWLFDGIIHSTIFPRGTFFEMMFNPDSETIWMRSMVCFITLLAGFFMQSIISRKRQAEEEAVAARKLFQLVLNTIPVRVFWKDRRGSFLGCNRLFAEDAGKEDPSELIGMNDFDFNWKEQAELYRADDLQVFKTGKAKLNYEECQTTPEGKKIWLSTSKVPLTDEEGDIVGILGTYKSITDRKAVEEMILEREMLLESTLESLAEGILIVDNKGQVISSNSNFAEMWRIPRELIEERNDQKLIEYVLEQLIDPQAFIDKVEKLYLSSEKSHDFLEFKDGRKFERFSTPLYRNGKILGRVWSFRDTVKPNGLNQDSVNSVEFK